MNTSTTTSSGIDTATSTGGISAPMVAALEAAWAAIRVRHPEVPAAVIVLGAGSGHGPGLKLGHFAAMRWHNGDQAAPADVEDDGDQDDGEQDGDHADEHEQDADPTAARLPEVFVGGEGLARGPADVLATLLHEAAHALGHVREIKDTSRQGRWHNAKFKALAEELGIEVTKDDRIGWSPTTLPASTRETYEAVIGELGRVLRLYRSVETSGGSGTKAKPAPPLECGCGRKIRVGKTVLALGPILCGVCGTEFTANELDADEHGAAG